MKKNKLYFKDYIIIKNMKYSLFINEHIHLIDKLYTSIFKSRGITFEELCVFAYNNSTINESQLKQNRLWN